MRRSLTPELDAYLRHLVQAWLAADERRKAGDLADRAGVSEGHLSNWLKNRRGISGEAAESLAEVLGITWQNLVSSASPWGEHQRLSKLTPPPFSAVEPVAHRRYQDLPGWMEAVAVTMAEARAPSYAVEAAGRGIVSWPVHAVTPDLVVDEALRWIKHASFVHRREAETAVARAKSETSLAHASGDVAKDAPAVIRKAR